jgi:hypothetical protein
MFTDIKLAKERTEGFKEFCKNLSTKIPYEITVMVASAILSKIKTAAMKFLG